MTLTSGHFAGKNELQLIEHFQRELSRMKGKEWAFQLDYANKAFVQQGFAIRHEFRHVLEEFFKSDVGMVDFGEPTKAAEVCCYLTQKRLKNTLHRKYQHLSRTRRMAALAI